MFHIIESTLIYSSVTKSVSDENENLFNPIGLNVYSAVRNICLNILNENYVHSAYIA